MRVRYNLAKRKAQELLKEARIRKPPVKLNLIAKIKDIRIRKVGFEGKEDASGIAYQSPSGDFVVGVNAGHHPNRQRFTIAHEIGHITLHKGEPLHIDKKIVIGFRDIASGTAQNPHEIEANQFAAELLMPTSFIEAEPLLQEMDIDDLGETISKLAKKYKVSVQAMTIRLTSLGLGS